MIGFGAASAWGGLASSGTELIAARGLQGAFAALLAPAALAGNHLHGDLALELLVPGQPDDAEAAGAEAALHPVAIQDDPGARAARERLCRVRTA